MKATATAGEKPKLTLGQRLHTQAVLMRRNGGGDKNVKQPSGETVGCTYISLQQPQFRKASFQTIKTPREDRLIIGTRWRVRGLWGRHRGRRVVQQVLLSDGNSAAARREDYSCSGTGPRSETWARAFAPLFIAPCWPSVCMQFLFSIKKTYLYKTSEKLFTRIF